MAIPVAADFNDSSVTEAQFKTAMSSLLGWLGGASSPVLKADVTATLTKGFSAGTTAAENVSGTFTPAVADGNIRSFALTANGTLACPSAAGSYAFVVNRSASLFTLSLSGFDKVSGTITGQWVLVSVVKTATRSVAFVDNI